MTATGRSLEVDHHRALPRLGQEFPPDLVIQRQGRRGHLASLEDGADQPVSERPRECELHDRQAEEAPGIGCVVHIRKPNWVCVFAG